MVEPEYTYSDTKNRDVMATKERESNQESETHQYGSITLTRNRVVRFLLSNKYVQSIVHLITVSLFIYAIYRAFVGPSNADINFGSVAFFGLWWSPIMIISLLLFGRVWCYFCPLGAIVRFTQRFGLQRHFPMFTGPKWTVFGLSFSVLSLTAISFVLARLPLYKFGVAWTPDLMGWYFLLITGIAVAVSLVFQRQAFCRYLCPASGVMSVTAKLSPFEIAQNAEMGVACATLEYKSDYLSTDRRCVSCMKCTTEKPDQDVELRLRWPGARAVTQKIPLVDEALLALIIWAIFPIDHVLGDMVESTAIIQHLPDVLSSSVPYFISISTTILVFGLVTNVATRWSGLDWEQSFTNFALAYTPLGIMFSLGKHVIPGLMESGGLLLNRFAAGLGLTLRLPARWASETTVAAWQQFFVTGWMWLAVLWGALIAWQIASVMTTTRKQAVKAFFPHLLLMAGSTYGVVLVLMASG
jgi:polyferredoxin